MAPVHIKLFLALVFLVGMGFCQNDTSTTVAAATPTVAAAKPTVAAATPTVAATSSTTTSTSRPSVTNSLYNMATAVPIGIIQAFKFGLTAFSSLVKQIAYHKTF